MKRGICALLALMLLTGLFSVCAAEGRKEIAVDGVSFADAADVSDNNRVFYEIFVGSFSDSDGDGVGDLRGIINRMDYLNDGDPESGLSLGIEGIWLTPIFQSPTYHKYDVTDFYKVDPAFGTEEDLKELIELCHARGVKLILDLPINHTSTDCRWFKNFVNAHLMHNPDNTYYNFYHWLDAGETAPAGQHYVKVSNQSLRYEANFSDSMPEPDFDQQIVRETFLDVALHYLEMGVDGFRFDAAKYIYFGDNEKSAAFWEWYIGELKKVNPELYTVAEVWDGDGVIDRYVPMTDCFNFTASQAEGIIAKTAQAGDVNRFTAYIETQENHLHALRADARNVLFVSNHDMDRAAGYLPMSNGRMMMAANLYLLSPGSPFIYYGEEIGLRGSRGSANTDANRRLAMLWGDGDTVQDPAGANYAKQTTYSVEDLKGIKSSLLNHYKKLIMIRKANPEIARGTYTALQFTGTKLGGFISEWEGKRVMVLHNATGAALTVDLTDVNETGFTRIVAVAGAGEASLDGTTVTLDGQTSAVLR